MRFDILHRLVTAAVVWVGFGALFLSGEFGLSVVLPALAFPVAGIFSWRLAGRRHSGRLAGLLAVLGGVGAGWMAFSTTDYLLWAIKFAVFLACLKSLYLRMAVDFMHMYALSFLTVMAAAVVNPGLSFGIVMLPYTVLLVFGLMLNSLRQNMERSILDRGRPDSAADAAAFMGRRGIIRRRFVLVTVGITLAVFFSNVLFFLLFPRMGLGFFARQQRQCVAMTGFSEEVTLGDFGNIISDLDVVMRVVPNGGPEAGMLRLPLRMKGQSLDSYDGRTWRKTTPRRYQLDTGEGGLLRPRRSRDEAPPGPSFERDVYLEPMPGTVRVLFGEPMITGFRPPMGMLDAMRTDKLRFFADPAGDVTMTGPESTALVYTVESSPPPSDPALLRVAGDSWPQRIKDLYLPVPPQDPGVSALARRIAAGRDNAFDIAVAMENELRNGWAYSLDSVHGNTDPVADFLLRNKTGHCEYFASSMVIMLRVLGIPARIVNGFYGGERNEFGNYVALRKSDAHSWVEVYFPGSGWAVFDPTPPGALDLRKGGGLLAEIRAAIDAVKLTWYQWVIEYDLEKQFEMVARLLKVKKDKGFGDNINRRDIRRIAREIRNLPWGTIFGIPVLLFGLFVGVRALAPRVLKGRGLPSAVPAVIHYRRARRMLHRRGLVRAGSETQIEFAARAGVEFPSVAADLELIAWQYCAVLAGRQPSVPPGELDAALERIRRALAS